MAVSVDNPCHVDRLLAHCSRTNANEVSIIQQAFAGIMRLAPSATSVAFWRPTVQRDRPLKFLARGNPSRFKES